MANETAPCDGWVCGDTLKKGSIPGSAFDREKLKIWLLEHIRRGTFTQELCGIDCGQWIPTGNVRCQIDTFGHLTGTKEIEMQHQPSGALKWVAAGVDLALCPVEVVIENPDYVLMTCHWEPGAGVDLDSAIMVAGSGLTDMDGLSIGWRMNGNSNPALSEYMKWGGDNMQSGAETVLLDLARLRSVYAQLNPLFYVELYANWYGSVGNGYATISVSAWRGGTMRREGTVFVNDGGTLMLDSAPLTVHVAASGENSWQNHQTLYSHVGYVEYRKTNIQNQEFKISIAKY
jgi:hypothetical protein